MKILSKYLGIILFIFGCYLLLKPVYFYTKGIIIQYIINKSWEEYKNKGFIKNNIFNIEPIGRIIIPDIDLDFIILDGTKSEILSYGPGRVISSSKLYNNKNNITIASHRDSFFKSIENINIDDEIFIEHINGESIYIVSNIDVLHQNLIETYDDVLQHISSTVNEENKTLVLFTCYPFDYIGEAPERFIVLAKLLS